MISDIENVEELLGESVERITSFDEWNYDDWHYTPY